MAKEKRIIIDAAIPDSEQRWGGINDGSTPQTVLGTTVPAGYKWGVDFKDVENYIKDELRGRVGCFYYDTATNYYMCFANEECKDLYYEDPVAYAYLLLGTFEAPFNYSARINYTGDTYVSVLKGTTGTFLEYSFNILNKEGAETGDDVNVSYTFTNSGTKQYAHASYASGTSVQFLVDKYLRTGENRITIAVTGATTLAATSQMITVFVVDLSLASDFDFSVPHTTQDTLSIPYSVSGIGLKGVECFLDSDTNTPIASRTSITDNSYNGQFFVNLASVSSLGAGRHWLQLRAYMQAGSATYYSRVLFFHIKIIGDNEPCFLFAKEMEIGTLNTTGALSLAAVQYDELQFRWAYYHPTQGQNAVTITTPDSVSNVTASSRQSYTFTYQPVIFGEGQTILFSANGSGETLYVNVEESHLGINEVTEGLVCRLTALGRSNAETNKNTWSYDGQNYATFTGFDWTAQSGWNGEALVVKKGTSVTINVKPFKDLVSSRLATAGGGVSVDIDFETDNVDDENADVITCFSDGRGVKFTATGASITTQNNVSVSTKFKPKDRRRICLTMHANQGSSYNNLVTIVNNGMLERANNYAVGDSLYLPEQKIVIGSQYVTVKIYRIVVYSRDLTPDQSFGNYAVGSPNHRQIVNANDVLESGSVSYEKVRGMIPTFLFTVTQGSMNDIINARSKNDNIRADVEYHNPQDPTYDFTVDTAYICPQGTSSLAYPIKNLRLYTGTKKEARCKMYDYQGNQLSGGNYSFKSGAQPVNVWTLKADYAESSMSHNTGTAKLWNDVMKGIVVQNKYVCRSRAMAAAINGGYQYDVRVSIDGFPCCVFYRDDESQSPIYMGQFNFDNDKSTESVFGFKGIDNDYTDDFGTTFGSYKDDIECWESLNNADQLCLFQDSDFYTTKEIDGSLKPAWEGAFEARYPDDGSSANTAYLHDFATWLVGLKGLTQANRQAFATQKWEHLDVYKVAVYYIYLMRHGAVDQPVKNSMLTTEGYFSWKRTVNGTTVEIVPHENTSTHSGRKYKKYYFQWYDNDTAHGINNDSVIVNDPYIDRQSFEGTSIETYAYAGHDSTLWNLLEGDEEFMGIVTELDRLIGLTYERCCQYYDIEQSSVWPARLYNASQLYKYIEHPGRLWMLQGSRESHRHWWLKTRYDLYDSRFVSGNYRNRAITFKANQVSGDNDGTTNPYTFTVTSGSKLYYGYGINNVVSSVTPSILQPGETVTFAPRALAVGDPVNIFGASHIEALDLSLYAARLASIDLSNVYDDESGSRMKRLILGANGTVNSGENGLKNLDLADSNKIYVPSLEELDITGFQNSQLTSINGLDRLTQIHKLRAANTILSSVTFAEGVSLTQVVLPNTLQQLTLNRATIAVNALTYTPNATFRELTARNCAGFDSLAFVQAWVSALDIAGVSYGNRSLVLEGIDWNTDADFMCDLFANGWQTMHITGTVRLASVSEEQMDRMNETFGDGWYNPAGRELVFIAPDLVIVNGPSVVVEGGSEQFTCAIVPFPEGQIEYQWSIREGSRTGTSIDNTGLLTVAENGSASAQLTIGVRYRVNGGSYSGWGTKVVQAQKAVYPTSSTSSLLRTEISSSIVRYTFQTTTVDVNGRFRINWSLSGDAATDCTYEVSDDGMSIIITRNVGVVVTTGTISYSLVKLCDGSTIFTNTEEASIFDDTIAFTSAINQYLMSLMYSKGFASNSAYMTKAECANVYDDDLNPGTSYSTSIFYANSSFRNNATSLEELKYFTSLTKLKSYLFSSCSKLQVVMIPEGVDTIESHVFDGCTALRTISLPSTLLQVRSVPSGLIKTLYISDLAAYAAIDFPNGAFDTYIDEHHVFLNGEEISGTIEVAVPSIGTYAFYGWPVTSAVIKNTVTSIGVRAFQNCSKLTSVTIGNSVTSIGDYAFYGCNSLTSISIPSSVTSIGFLALNSRLDSVYITDLSAFCRANIQSSSGLFAQNENTKLYLNNTEISNLVIPSDVTALGANTFQYAYFDSVTLGNNVISVGANTFQGCKMSHLIIGSSLNAFQSTSFRGTQNLETITVDSENESFYSTENCNAIIRKSDNLLIQGSSNTVIPNTVTSINEYAFYSNKKLASISIPGSVISIGDQAFYGCTNLTSIIINEGLQTLGSWVFSSNLSLLNIVLPSSITTVNTLTFSGIGTQHTRVLFKGAPPTVQNVGGATEIPQSICYVPYNYYEDYLYSDIYSRFIEMHSDFTPTTFSALSINADDAKGRSTRTTVYFTATANGHDNYYDEDVTGREITGKDKSDPFGQNPSTTDSRTITVTYTKFGRTASTTITQAAYESAIFEVDQNSQWRKSSKNPYPNLYDAYESFSNWHVNNGVATMYINIDGYDAFNVYIRSYGETYSDYVQISQLDQTPVPGNYSQTTTTKAHTYSKSTSQYTLAAHTSVSYTEIDGGQHVITIIYRKDASGDSYDDRGYILIPKTQ